jgi:hypothetical protein
LALHVLVRLEVRRLDAPQGGSASRASRASTSFRVLVRRRNKVSNTKQTSAHPSQIPELEPHCGSWVCSRNDGYRFETFSIRTARCAAERGYRIETAAEYLARINRESSSVPSPKE